MNYEAELFKVAPWTKDVMTAAKDLNNSSIMRGRSGWIKRRIENPESIYEHSCKVGLAAHYLLGSPSAVSIAVVHDLSEIYEKDYLPGEISSEEKRQKEIKSMKKASEQLPNGKLWFGAWMTYEYKAGEGKVIYELDKMCPVIQSIDYLHQGKGENLEEFYLNARNKITTPKLIELLDIFWLGGNRHKNVYKNYFKTLESIKY